MQRLMCRGTGRYTPDFTSDAGYVALIAGQVGFEFGYPIQVFLVVSYLVTPFFWLAVVVFLEQFSLPSLGFGQFRLQDQTGIRVTGFLLGSGDSRTRSACRAPRIRCFRSGFRANTLHHSHVATIDQFAAFGLRLRHGVGVLIATAVNTVLCHDRLTQRDRPKNCPENVCDCHTQPF